MRQQHYPLGNHHQNQPQRFIDNSVSLTTATTLTQNIIAITPAGNNLSSLITNKPISSTNKILNGNNSPNVSSLNQKIILVKTKYNNATAPVPISSGSNVDHTTVYKNCL